MSQYSDISKPAFEGALGAIFGLTIISVIARTAIRITSRRSLYWDDLALFTGVITLTAATAVALMGIPEIFLGNQLVQDPASAFTIGLAELIDVESNSRIYLYSFLDLAWTTIFAVKISFLIFFKQLIYRLGKIQVYFWCVTCFTVVSWMFLVAHPFILCPFLGAKSLQCVGPTQDKLFVSMTALVTVFDILSDIMIASIPILVLQKSQIAKKQKITIACFLSLSLVMTTFAIIRVSKMHGATNTDLVWMVFWQWMEAAIAVIMASITTFRTTIQAKETSQQRKWEPSLTWMQRMKLKRSSGKKYRNNRTAGHTTVVQTDVGLSHIDKIVVHTIDEEEECCKGDTLAVLTEDAHDKPQVYHHHPSPALMSQSEGTTSYGSHIG